MTRDEILAMQPGPELDASLGKALGATVERYDASYGGDLYWLILPGWHGSIDWTTERGAWSGMPPLSSTWEGLGLIVEAMAARGYWLLLKSPFRPREPYFAGFTAHNETGWDEADFKASGKDAPHAVAIAARLALEEEQ